MKISVVIPVYNAAKYLRECLDSVRVQTFTDFEVICVDDGSTDESAAILDEYAAKDGRFAILHQKNSGEGVARNAGFSAAHGEIIGWLDSDDILDRGVFEEVADVFSTYNCEAVRIRHERFEGPCCRPCTLHSHAAELITGIANVRSWALDTLTGAGYCWAVYMLRQKYARQFPAGVQYAGDALFMLANMFDVSCVVQSEYVGYYYRDNPNSIMKKRFPSAERVRFFNAFVEIAKLYGVGHAKISWMGWFNLVNWCLRPKDLTARDEIHQIFFFQLVKNGFVNTEQLPFYARLVCWSYLRWGFRFPIVLAYRFLIAFVKARDFLKNSLH